MKNTITTESIDATTNANTAIVASGFGMACVFAAGPYRPSGDAAQGAALRQL